MFTKKIMAAATVAIAAMGMAAGTASADTIKVAGTALSSGDRLIGSTANAQLSTSLGNINCASAFRGTVTSNATGAGNNILGEINPANLSRSPVDSLTFTGCTDTIFLINVQSAVINGDVGITGRATGSNNGTLTLTDITVDVTTNVNTCSYNGDVTGVFTYSTQNLVFTNQSVDEITGNFGCPSTGTFSATYSTDVRSAANVDKPGLISVTNP